MNALESLVSMSRKYGSDAEFVLAGGGNTSYKTEDTLYVKGSGTSLSTISENGFVRMSRKALNAMWDKKYSDDEKEREACVLSDMMSARLPGEDGKRPSVETLLHNLLPQKYVLHVHPALVNGITCSVGGQDEALKLFPESVWVESTKPGYILASLCREKIAEYVKSTGKAPELIFLQNHGVFFAGDDTEKIDRLTEYVMAKIKAAVQIFPCREQVLYNKEAAPLLAPEIRMLYSNEGRACVKFTAYHDIIGFGRSKEAFAALNGSFTPDHIVYCKADPLYVEESEDLAASVKSAFEAYVSAHGYAPKIIFVQNVGMFACGKTKKEADTASVVFEDAIKIATYAMSFGGYLHMSDGLKDFIVNWEVESYRAKVALSSSSSKRLEGKIAIVTGAAQGFGAGIAEDMLSQGAYIAVADMNLAGAQATADRFNEKFGAGSAFAIGANVSDEDSVKAMLDAVTLEYGGLDIFVNNAGIVRAGSLDEMTKQNFELVTAVNYTAYFLCAKYASKVLKIQHAYAPDYMTDIIEINSKSGLSGSNKNFAYAGSKFGGLGLTQSFALELAPYNIKVNAICPGNYLDGPLWSDPVRGLFVQYLNAGKVPGAKTVEDVRKYYESKVPLGRGCLPADISRALFYIVEQKYETGQALPVTGGQEMLK